MSTVAEPQTQEWTFPQDLEVGQRIVVSTDAHFTSPAAGIIAGLEPNAAWLFMFGGNSSEGPIFGPLEDCWHKDDPRVKRMPHLIGPHEARGIFRLADSEERIKTHAEQFHVLERAMEAFVPRFVAMEAQLEKVEQINARLVKLERSVKALGK